MTRTFTGLCVAAAFGMVASVGAQTGQTSGTTADPSQHSRSTMNDRGSKHDEVTVTGCLQKGADGNYILTNAHVDENEASSGASSSYHGATGTTSGTTGTSTTSGTSTTTGTTASGTSTGTTASGTTGESSSMGSTWQLEGGKDLEKHVGHKIQVKGHMAMGSSSENNTSTGTTGTTAGAMSGTTGTTTGTTATSGTTGTTTGTTATGTSGTTAEPEQSMHHGETSATSASHRLDVKSVKMISTSCS